MKLFIVLFIFANAAFSIDLQQYKNKCHNITTNLSHTTDENDLNKPTCNNQAFATPLKELTKLTGTDLNSIQAELGEELVLIEEAEILYQDYEKHVKLWGDFQRYLQGVRFSKDKEDEYNEIYKSLQDDLAKIQEIHDEIKSTQEKIKSCLALKCSRSWSLELEDTEKLLTKYYNELLISSPLWLSQELEPYLNDPDSMTPRELLISNMANGFKKDSEIKSNLFRLKRALSEDFINDSNREHSLHSTSYALIHDETIDLVLTNSLNNLDSKPVEKQMVICKYIEENSLNKKVISTAKQGADLTFSLLSLSPLLGTPSKARSITSSLLSKSANIGRTGIVASLFHQYENSKLSCEIQSSQFKNEITLDKYNSWKACHKKTNDLKFALALNALPLQTSTRILKNMGTIAQGLRPYLNSATSQKVFQTYSTKQTLDIIKQGKSKFAKGKQSFITIEENKNTITLLNMQKMSPQLSKKANQISDDYLDVVGEVYNTKLKILSKEQVSGFIETSKQFRNRTQLIVLSHGSPKKDTIFGGVASVKKSTPQELLPLEKATGFRVPHRPGENSIEIVRLTSKEANHDNMRTLLTQIAQINTADEKLKNVYMFTSKVHYRLYKRLGINGEIIHQPNKKEVVVQMSIDEIKSLIQ